MCENVTNHRISLYSSQSELDVAVSTSGILGNIIPGEGQKDE
jgi:hypothetical protein